MTRVVQFGLAHCLGARGIVLSPARVSHCVSCVVMCGHCAYGVRMGTNRTGLARPPEVADYLGTTVGGLAQMRRRGTGPAFVKMGQAIRYDWADVFAFVESNKQSGSDDHE